MAHTASHDTTRSERPAKKESDPVISAFALAQMAPSRRLAVLRKGLSAREVNVVALKMGRSREYVIRALHFKRATITRKLRDNTRLTTADSERLLAIPDMIEQVQQMVERSGNPKGFDSAKWLAVWLDTPNGALGGQPPVQFLDTNEGIQIVRRLLAQMETGAYA